MRDTRSEADTPALGASANALSQACSGLCQGTPRDFALNPTGGGPLIWLRSPLAHPPAWHPRPRFAAGSILGRFTIRPPSVVWLYDPFPPSQWLASAPLLGGATAEGGPVPVRHVYQASCFARGERTWARSILLPPFPSPSCSLRRRPRWMPHPTGSSVGSQ